MCSNMFCYPVTLVLCAPPCVRLCGLFVSLQGINRRSGLWIFKFMVVLFKLSTWCETFWLIFNVRFGRICCLWCFVFVLKHPVWLFTLPTPTRCTVVENGRQTSMLCGGHFVVKFKRGQCAGHATGRVGRFSQGACCHIRAYPASSWVCCCPCFAVILQFFRYCVVQFYTWICHCNLLCVPGLVWTNCILELWPNCCTYWLRLSLNSFVVLDVQYPFLQILCQNQPWHLFVLPGVPFANPNVD